MCVYLDANPDHSTIVAKKPPPQSPLVTRKECPRREAKLLAVARQGVGLRRFMCYMVQASHVKFQKCRAEARPTMVAFHVDWPLQLLQQGFNFLNPGERFLLGEELLQLFACLDLVA